MSAVASLGARRVASRAVLVDPRTVRLIAFIALGLFGALHWASLVVPSDRGALVTMLVIATVSGVGACALDRFPQRWQRIAGRVGIVLAVLTFTLLAAGLPAYTLGPTSWGELVDGIGSGLEALPGLRIPYRGIDEWTRGVLLCGGGLLLALAASLALSPRQPRLVSSAVCLGALYTVPIVQRGPGSPYLDGAVFTLLLATLLFGERLHGAGAPLAVALLVGTVLIGALVGPRLDAQNAWIDYEKLADSLQTGKTTSFSWNHSYGPLTWPREGREMLRIKSTTSMYWKAEALEEFDGRTWRQVPSAGPGGVDTTREDFHSQWIKTIGVSVRGLRSTAFVGAGTTLRIADSTRAGGPATPGTFHTLRKPLRRGDDYQATVYVPRPSDTQLHGAPIVYPPWLRRQLTMDLPAGVPRNNQTRLGKITITFAPFDSDLRADARSQYGFGQLDAGTALEASPYGRMYELAQQLAAGSRDPYDFVLRVQARVRRDAIYTESPRNPAPLEPLDAFLFRDHEGYCQHFSGAMALLLRMGGVPARVATGFSPGSRVGKSSVVVRDFDAHSWVEVYFPTLGWVTFDPTPADSPARSQVADFERPGSSAPKLPATTMAPSDRVSDPTSGGPAPIEDVHADPWAPMLMAVGVALALVTMPALLLWHRRRKSPIPDLVELQRALVRCGRAPAPDVTLARLERIFGGDQASHGYLRTLRMARYAGQQASPSPAQRRALRRELAAGLGLSGRLRALWALPPRGRELLAMLRPHRSRPYTG